LRTLARRGPRGVELVISTEAARLQWRQVADQLHPKVPKLTALMDEAKADVLAFISFPKDHRPKIYSTNPLERRNGEIKRRTKVVRISPNEPAMIPLVGAIRLEQNHERAVQRARYMALETVAPLSDDPLVKLPAVAADPTPPVISATPRSYTTPRHTIYRYGFRHLQPWLDTSVSERAKRFRGLAKSGSAVMLFTLFRAKPG
jgi:DNA-directed RNA polymerase subunit H (RpoH/RPB5)